MATVLGYKYLGKGIAESANKFMIKCNNNIFIRLMTDGESQYYLNI